MHLECWPPTAECQVDLCKVGEPVRDRQNNATDPAIVRADPRGQDVQSGWVRHTGCGTARFGFAGAGFFEKP